MPLPLKEINSLPVVFYMLSFAAPTLDGVSIDQTKRTLIVDTSHFKQYSDFTVYGRTDPASDANGMAYYGFTSTYKIQVVCHPDFKFAQSTQNITIDVAPYHLITKE